MTRFEEALRQTAVVIPSIQGLKLLQRLLPSIDVPPAQVVVVEQGSSDSSEDYCRSMGAHVLQLGRQATFTEASNAGIRWAMERGFRYICLANNDLRFVTPIVHQLLETCLDTPAAGAVAPTQVMISDGKIEWVAYRATWDLSKPRFGHDLVGSSDWPRDVDADFCEFTCVLVPTAVFADVGLLDDAYGFYHEDADWGFRLWLKGYRALYNQQAQVFHWGSSTVTTALGAQRKRELIQRNLKRFSDKHLRFGVNFLQETVMERPAHSWDVLVDSFSRTLRPLGLVRSDRPSFGLGHPGQIRANYLYMMWETTQLPQPWLAMLRDYQQIFVPSSWVQSVLQGAGFKHAHVFPLGIDPNTFHPAGRYTDLGSKVFLVNARPQHRKALDLTLTVWRNLQSRMPEATLAFFCPGEPLEDSWIGETPVPSVQGSLYRRWYPRRRVWLLQPTMPLTYGEMAEIYRGAHCLVLNSRSEGFGLPVIEAMACGTLCIVPDYGATAEFIKSGNSLPIGGTSVEADYSDKGFNHVGTWWEPSQADLERQLLHAYNMSEPERAEMTKAARTMAVTQYTWRSVARTFHAQLAQVQEGAESERGARAFRISWRALVQTGDRYVRGPGAEGLIRAGKFLERLGRVLRAQGVTSMATKVLGKVRNRIGWLQGARH